MLDLQRVLNQDRLVRAMTGLNRQAFEALLPTFKREYEGSLLARNQVRQRAVGGGAKAKLETPTEKLFYILFY